MTSRTASFVLPLLALLAGAGPAAAAQSRAFVWTTDFSTGGLSTIDLNTHSVSQDVEPVGSDAAMRWYAGNLYVVNRFGGDNVQVIDGTTLNTLRQISTGNGSNPQDICFLSPTKAYVTRYELGSLLIVNPATGGTLGTISLAQFADADGIPEMARMVRVDRYVFVALQRLNRNGGFVPTDSSLVAVIDAEADTVLDVDPALPGKQAIHLTGTNPVTTFEFDRATSRLLLGCVGNFGALDGGIEWIDPVNFRSLGFAITEAALGGDVGDVVWNGPGHSYAIVSDASFNTSLVSWSATTGLVLGTVFSPGGYSLTDAALDDRGEVYVCDNSFAHPGVSVFAAASDTHLAGPLDCGLPAHDVTFDAPSDQVLDVPVAEGTVELAAPEPNPATSGSHLRFALARAGTARLEVFDPQGRRVRTLWDGPVSAGVQDIGWDLRDDSGRAVSAGVYLIRLAAAGRVDMRRIVTLR
jgi:DNA-binding beta-propeller fold protein YncE